MGLGLPSLHFNAAASNGRPSPCTSSVRGYPRSRPDGTSGTRRLTRCTLEAAARGHGQSVRRWWRAARRLRAPPPPPPPPTRSRAPQHCHHGGPLHYYVSHTVRDSGMHACLARSPQWCMLRPRSFFLSRTNRPRHASESTRMDCSTLAISQGPDDTADKLTSTHRLAAAHEDQHTSHAHTLTRRGAAARRHLADRGRRSSSRAALAVSSSQCALDSHRANPCTVAHLTRVGFRSRAPSPPPSSSPDPVGAAPRRPQVSSTTPPSDKAATRRSSAVGSACAPSAARPRPAAFRPAHTPSLPPAQ